MLTRYCAGVLVLLKIRNAWVTNVSTKTHA
jgi:hypothetical protein